MYVASDTYKQLALANGRTIDVLISIGGVNYQTEVIEFNIQHELSSDLSDIAVGMTPSARLSLKLNTLDYIASGAMIKPYVKFIGPAAESEYYPLGVFYCDNRYIDRGIVSITAYDKMLDLSTLYETELTYPKTLEEVFVEICEQLSISKAFTAPEITISYPLVDYTYREAIGVLAGFIGCNAIFDNEGYLSLTDFENVGVVDLKNCIEQSINNETVEITRIVCVKDSDNTYERGEGTDFHTLAYNNPLADDVSMDYVYAKLNGIKCNSIKIVKQGAGLYRIGDLIQTYDNNNRTQSVNAIVSYLEYDFQDCQFKETIESRLRTESQANYVNKTDLESVIKDQTNSLQEGIYTYKNTSTETIEETENNIILIRFIADMKCTPVFNAELEVVITAPGLLQFLYYIDGIEYPVYPKQTVGIGYYIIPLFLQLSIQKSSVVELKVAVIGDEGCSGYISKNQINAVVRGQGLSTNKVEWDGRFTIIESIEAPFEMSFSKMGFIDPLETVNTLYQISLGKSTTETIGQIIMTSQFMTLNTVYPHLQLAGPTLFYQLTDGVFEKYIFHSENTTVYSLNEIYKYDSSIGTIDSGNLDTVYLHDLVEFTIITEIEEVV